ncbi:hydroxymethylglutaryl-CoA synthase family protein [Mycolicibacterium porcinum]|uniref:OB-fold domain-containing protein n=1 Tax=Mycolicibacterium porcinum TaxID=39693 RepID=UPI0011973210|nr:OB-fold domain-containing protein [Mycolicibacterium porcinum]TVX95988.1 hydroxymethylglutaryl-CoA synthase family protein [Mycolicibacterium porcinum]
MTAGLLGYSAYLPGRRIGKNRVVASYDEDSTTMALTAAVELRQRCEDWRPAALYFATSTPAYADKTNATAIHAALGLPRNVIAADLVGNGRSSFAAIIAAASTEGLVVGADVRVGRPGSSDEKLGGDAGAALLFGDDREPIAEILATASRTDEFLDRWRLPTAVTGEQWEERYGATHYSALIREVAEEALDEAGVADVEHVALACPNSAVLKRAATLVKGQKSVISSPAGFSGSVDMMVALAAVLDNAEPGEHILVLSATDGCDALLLRTTTALPNARQATPVAEQRTAGTPVPHLTYLSWRGLVELEPPRRPEPDRPAAPPAGRSVAWKFALTGARCLDCGFVHLPAIEVCRSCGGRNVTERVRINDRHGTVSSYTVDHLAFSPSPPMVQAAVDVDGGGRFMVEIADADPERLSVGARVRFVFRRLFTAGNVHDYFWKAVLIDGQ